MGRVRGVSQGHKLSDYVKLNEKPSKRTKKYKKKSWGHDLDIGKTDREVRYDG